MSRRSVDFGELRFGTDDSREESLTIVPLCNVSSLRVVCDEDWLSSSVEMDGSGIYTIKIVNTSKNLELGKVRSSITLNFQSSGSEVVPPIEVPVFASVVEDVKLVPDLFHLGCVPVGGDAYREFRVVSREGRGIKLLEIETVSGDALANIIGESETDVRVALKQNELGETVSKLRLKWGYVDSERTGVIDLAISSNGVNDVE